MDQAEADYRLARTIEIALRAAEREEKILEQLEEVYDAGDREKVFFLAGALLGRYDVPGIDSDEEAPD